MMIPTIRRFPSFLAAGLFLFLATAGFPVVRETRVQVSASVKAEWYLELSLRAFRDAIKQRPTDGLLRERYLRLLESARGSIPARLDIIAVLTEAGKPDEARNFFLKLPVGEQEEITGVLRRKAAAAKTPLELTAVYSTLATLFSDNGEFWYQWGRACRDQGDRRGAVALFETAIAKGFRTREIYLFLVQEYRDRKEYGQAYAYAREGADNTGDRALQALATDLSRFVKSPVTPPEPGQATETPVVQPSPSPAGPLAVRPFILFAVSKDHQKLFLLEFTGAAFQKKITFPCTTGRNGGDKKREGDLRTPEGTYLLVSRKNTKKLPSKYGVAAFELNYPNVLDRREGKTGDGIWFHATPDMRPPYNSMGCVVLNDPDMRKVLKYIHPRRTFLFIADTFSSVPTVPVADILSFVADWKSAWESKDVVHYAALYDAAFVGEGQTKARWFDYKKRVIGEKKFIKVDLADMQVLPYGKKGGRTVYAVFFRQKYDSNLLKSENDKILYLVVTDNGFRVLGEEVI